MVKYECYCNSDKCAYLNEKNFSRCKFTKSGIEHLEDYNQEICKGGCDAKYSDLVFYNC